MEVILSMNNNKHSDLDDESMNNNKHSDLDDDLDHEGINRRQFMHRVGATTLGAGAAYYGGVEYAGSPVGDAEAIACGGLCLGAAAVGTAIAVGWALREYEVVGSDAPAEGLTGDVLKQQVYQTALTRKSTNASTFLDNQNILDGVKHTAYVDAKISAIEQMNAGVSESEVQTTAQDAVSAYLVRWNRIYSRHGMSRSASYTVSGRLWSRILTLVRVRCWIQGSLKVP